MWKWHFLLLMVHRAPNNSYGTLSTCNLARATVIDCYSSVAPQRICICTALSRPQNCVPALPSFGSPNAHLAADPSISEFTSDNPELAYQKTEEAHQEGERCVHFANQNKYRSRYLTYNATAIICTQQSDLCQFSPSDETIKSVAAL